MSKKQHIEGLESKIHRISRLPTLSPLRYPGGKRKLVPLVADIFSRAGVPVELLVEPFAGGAGVAIALLEAGMAHQIALSDKDDLVAAFWKTVFSENATALADMIYSNQAELGLWRRLKQETPTSDLHKAFKCIFLNRTSFSGILHQRAGPIGGMTQAGRYKIDCRYNREALAARILALSEYRKRVMFVRCQSFVRTLSDVKKLKIARKKSSHIFWYLDPPFFEKADQLYRFAFTAQDHKTLSSAIYDSAFPGHWVLSYDDVSDARNLYSNHPGFCRVNLSYNARIDTYERLTCSEIVVSNVIASMRCTNPAALPPMGKIIALKEGFFKTPFNHVTVFDQHMAGTPRVINTSD